MSSVSDNVKCPQCEYGQADYDFECGSAESVTACRRCGYYESLDRIRDDDGYFCGWEHRVCDGAGALGCKEIGQVGSWLSYLNTRKQVLEAEQWLRNELAQGRVDPAVSYLTKWNDEASQVELVIGKFWE